VMKMDVRGYELNVLKGAKQLLKAKAIKTIVVGLETDWLRSKHFFFFFCEISLKKITETRKHLRANYATSCGLLDLNCMKMCVQERV
jgi:hypothetical protein